MRQTRLTWQIISGLLGLLFIIWGSITHLFTLLPGDVWLVLPGSLMLAICIFGIVEDILASRPDNESEESA